MQTPDDLANRQHGRADEIEKGAVAAQQQMGKSGSHLNTVGESLELQKGERMVNQSEARGTDGIQ